MQQQLSGSEQKNDIALTNSGYLLPVGVVHVNIQGLLAMEARHSPNTAGDMIEGFPKCLYQLAINHTRTFDVC